MEEIHSNEAASHFIFPSFKDENGQDERGEIERVREYFNITSPDFTEKFLERARLGRLTELSEEQWAALENTDSLDIQKGDWDRVAYHAEHQNRDWRNLKHRLQSGLSIDAPVIARRGDILHLVTGNTRLMVSRALGIQPEVLIVDATDFQ